MFNHSFGVWSLQSLPDLSALIWTWVCRFSVVTILSLQWLSVKENKHHILILLIFQEFFVFCIMISVVVWISPLGFLLMNILWFNCTSRTYSYFKWKNDCSFMKIPGSLITRLKCTIWAHSMQFARNISNYLISNLNTTCISIAKVIWVIWEEIGTHQAKKKHPSSRKPLFPDHSEGFMQYLRSTCINE